VLGIAEGVVVGADEHATLGDRDVAVALGAEPGHPFHVLGCFQVHLLCARFETPGLESVRQSLGGRIHVAMNGAAPLGPIGPVGDRQSKSREKDGGGEKLHDVRSIQGRVQGLLGVTMTLSM
jgi:hypothetical protein